MKFEATPNRVVAFFAAAMAAGLQTAASVQADTFTWSGNGGGNNWDGNNNWSGASGVPDGATDYVHFPNNAGHHNVDLNNGDWDVGGIVFNNSSNTYHVKSTEPDFGVLDGNLRNNGDLISAGTGYVYFDDTTDYYQKSDGTWNLLGNPDFMVFNATINGNHNITLQGGVTLNRSNSYYGTLTIASGSQVRLGDDGALHNARVVLNGNNGLDLTTNSVNGEVYTLEGSGNLNVGSNTLTVESAQQNTFSGNITGSSSPGEALYGAFVVGGTNTNALYTINGDVSGLDTLKTTGCTLVLDGNTVTLDTHSSAGGLILGGGNVSIINGAQVTVQNAGKVYVDARTLSINGGALITGQMQSNDGVVDLTDPSLGQALTIGLASGTSHSSTFNGFLTGTGSFRKVGTGSWELSKSNTFSGDAVIDNGTVILDKNISLQNATVWINVDDGLDINSLNTPYIGALAGSGSLDIGSSSLTVGSNGSGTTYSGVLSGNGAFSKAGGGALTLSGANTFSGSANINNGKVILGNVNALQNATVSINTNDGLDINALDVNLGGLAGSGDLSVGPQNVSVGSNGGDTIYSGVLSGSGSLTKQGAGALTLTDNLNQLGKLTNTGGDLNIDGGGDIDILLVQAGVTSVRGQMLDLNSETTNTLFISGSGAASIANGAVVTLTGTSGSNRVVLTSNALLSVQDTGSKLVTPRLDIGPSGAGSAEVIAELGGAIEADRLRVGDLAGDDGAAGTLTILSGGTVVADQTILLRRGSIVISGDGTLSTDKLIDGDAESHTIAISDTAAGSALTVGTNNGDSTFDGLIQDAVGGPGSLLKTGAGSFTLTNANTFSGGVSIDGGTLLTENVSGSATGTGDVQVSGGTLGGNGIVGGAAIVSAAGTVAPGISVGTLTVDSVIFGSGSTLSIELSGNGGVAGTDYDQLFVAGTATIEPGSTLDLSYLNGFTAAPGDQFVILTAMQMSETFETVHFPDSQNWTVDYDTDAGTITVGLCDDTDADGVCDQEDICPGFDDNTDTDSDGTPDGCDACAAGAASGDTDASGSIDLADYAEFNACLGGSVSGACGCFDFDIDGDNDLRDFAEFQTNFTGP